MPKEKIEELKKELNSPSGEETETETETETEDEKFVEVEGVKYKEDPSNPGQALLDADEKPIPFKEIKEKKKEEKKEEGEEFVMPEKFKDKSPEEIAKSYNELEKMIGKKVEEGTKAEIDKLVKEGKITKVEAKKIEKETKKEIKLPMKDGEVDFSGMTPKQFSDWIIAEVNKGIEERVSKILGSHEKARTEVKTDIQEAQKDHPLLKKNKEYTELVVAIMSAGAAEGKEITLKEACSKVDAFKGGKSKEEIDEEEKKKLKKAKAAVETDGGAAPGGEEETEEKEIKRKLLEGSKSPMGGLGI